MTNTNTFCFISISNLKTGRFETRRFETWHFVNLTFCKPDVLKPDVLKPDVLKPYILKPDVLWVYRINSRISFLLGVSICPNACGYSRLSFLPVSLPRGVNDLRSRWRSVTVWCLLVSFSARSGCLLPASAAARGGETVRHTDRKEKKFPHT